MSDGAKQATVADKREIEAGMCRLENLVDETTDRFEVLSNRLSSVTKQAPLEPPSDAKSGNIPETGLGQRINESVRKLECLLEHMQNVVIRLEL